MVVRLRLQRFGQTHKPFYRMVAAHSKAPRDGRFLEIIGTYNPIASRGNVRVPTPGATDGNTSGGPVKEIRLKVDRIQYWLSVGAMPSDRVAWILGKFGILPPLPHKFSPEKMIPKKDRKKEKEA